MHYFFRNSHLKFLSDPEIQISSDLIDRWEIGFLFTSLPEMPIAIDSQWMADSLSYLKTE